MAGRVTQEAVEVAALPADANVRVTQETVEVATLPTDANVRVTQETIEVAALPTDANVRLTQEALEVAVLPADANVRMTQLALEVAVGQLPTSPTPPGTSGFGLPYDSVTPDPVDTLTGAYHYIRTDLAIAGRGPSPLFRRGYSSVDTRNLAGMSGGWTHNYAINVASPGDGTLDVILMGPEGRSDRYTHNADGSYTPPPAVYTTLVYNAGSNSYSATLTNQTTWTFRGDGRLTGITDRYGNQSVLSYNGGGQLVSVSDPAGRGSLAFAYSTPGSQLITITDWLSPARTVQFGYDSNGRLQTITDRNGKVTTYAYDGTSSRLATITDANSHVAVTNTYDSQGRVQTQKDALGLSTGQATTFGYVTNPDGTETTTVTYPTTSLEPTFNPTVAETYDTEGRIITRVTKPSSTETYTESYTYDSNFNRTSVTDARGNTTSFCFDVDYTGAPIFGSHGNLTRRIDPPPSAGANVPVTLFKYDSKNNLIEMIPPKGVSSGTTVTCSTDLSALINANYATDYAYDATGVQLLSVTRKFTDPDLGLQTAETKYEYGDSANPGLVTRIIPPRGNTGPNPDYTYATTMAYFASGSQAGMLQSSTDPDGNQTTYTYDAAGRRLTMVDPNGNTSGGVPGDHTWSYSYDAEDRLLRQVAPAPAHGGTALTTTFQYDPVGNRTVVIDANGQVTTYAYDVRDQLNEVDQSPNAWTDPNATPSPKYVTTYTYDNLGNLNRMTRAFGDATYERATDYLYGGSRHLRQEIQYPSWPTTTPTLATTYAYDGNGNRVSLVDPLSQTPTFTFDKLNRITGITYSDGVTPNVSYSYDANGNRATMVDGTGTTSYGYDEMDRLQSVTSPGPSTVGYRYDLDGNRTKLIYPDSTAVTYSFDKASRLTGLTDWASRTTGYTYLPDGHVQQLTNANGTTAQYSYDNAQRLTQVLNQDSSLKVIDQHTYTLDSVGTRSQVAEVLAQVGGGQITPTTAYGYDKLYELTADGATDYSYDPVGNRLSMGSTSYSYDKADRISAAGSTSYTVNANGNVTARGSDSFGYDQANRLKTATVSGTATTNTFDGDGKRASQTVDGNPAIPYVYDTDRSLPVVLSDGTLKYVWSFGLLYAVDGSGGLQVFHADGLGSARALTDGSATLLATYQTDAWGNPTASGGSSTQPFRFAGEQLDADGLVYLRARFYEAGTGRLIARDAAPGSLGVPASLNHYTYAMNSPVTNSDPSGLSTSRAASSRRGFAELGNGDLVGPLPTETPTRRDFIGPLPTETATPIPTQTPRHVIAPLYGPPAPRPKPDIFGDVLDLGLRATKAFIETTVLVVVLPPTTEFLVDLGPPGWATLAVLTKEVAPEFANSWIDLGASMHKLVQDIES